MPKRTDWKGVFTALVTPFKDDGSLDEDALAQLVRRQIEGGIHGLVPCGTTGESPALEENEWAGVIEITVREADGKAWVIAGTGTNNSAKSAARTRFAKDMGADGALVITPYYNKPTPDGLLRHFQFVAEQVPGFPIMVYNVPGRTSVNIQPDTMQRLVEIPEVHALKEASGDLGQVWEMAARFGGEIAVFSGEDGMNLPIWEVGGHGAVSVLSNVIPDRVVAQFKAHEEGNREKALMDHFAFTPLSKSLFVETSPAPAKYALGRLGLPAGEVRLPLSPLRDTSLPVIDRDLKELGLL